MIKCGLIFYMAHQTGYCETAIAGCLAAAGLSPVDISAAFSPELLVDALNKAFSHENIVFVVGGLARKDENNLADVLSKALSTGSPPQVKKIDGPQGKAQGYYLNSGKQILVALPDDPEQIPLLCSPALLAAAKEA